MCYCTSSDTVHFNPYQITLIIIPCHSRHRGLISVCFCFWDQMKWQAANEVCCAVRHKTRRGYLAPLFTISADRDIIKPHKMTAFTNLHKFSLDSETTAHADWLRKITIPTWVCNAVKTDIFTFLCIFRVLKWCKERCMQQRWPCSENCTYMQFLHTAFYQLFWHCLWNYFFHCEVLTGHYETKHSGYTLYIIYNGLYFHSWDMLQSPTTLNWIRG